MTNIKKKIQKNYILSALIFTALIALLAAGALSVRTTQAVLTDSTEPIDNDFSPYKKYTLSYHANAGVDTPNVKEIPKDQAEFDTDNNGEVDFTISEETPLRDGYVFAGWYQKESPASDDKKYEGKDTLTTDQRHTDLYAQWAAGYKLIYDANGGKNAPAARQQQSTDDSFTFTNLAEQGKMTGPEHADSSNPEKTSTSNRVFLGWSTDKNAKVPKYTSKDDGSWEYTGEHFDGDNTGKVGTEVTINAEDNPSKTVTLYAVWATKYELKFEYHPDMLVMKKPVCGTEKPETMTLISSSKEAHTFNLPSPAEAKAQNIEPTRTEGYRWGWWGDKTTRFKFKEPASGQTAVQAGNEGCYQFGEPVPARKEGDNSLAPNKDNPVLTLYAYFQPPSACSITFDDNSRIPTAWNSEGEPTSYIPNAKYPELTYTDANGDLRNDNVPDMPDNAGASTTEQEWEKVIPGGDGNTPKHPKWSFIGWSEDRDASEAQYQPGEKIKVNKVLNNKITLYAIWKPMHNFSLRFNINMPSGSGRIHFKKENGTWDYYTTNANNNNYIYYRPYTDEEDITKDSFLRKDPTVYFTDTSFTWSQEFFENEGLFATRADDSVGTYTFYGWSEEPVPVSTEVTKEDADYPVKAPTVKQSTNPNNQGHEYETPVGDQGLIKQAVTAEEGTPCTKPTTHHKVLYAVWRKSPKHQLRVVFDKGAASTMVDHTGKTVSSDAHYIDIDGVTQNASTYYASLDYPEYTWSAEYWATHTPTVTKADEEDKTATYTFLGWSTNEKHKTPSATITKGDIDYPVDDQGRITKEIKAYEPAAEAKDCKGGNEGSHTVKLYPVFRKNLFHVYQLDYDVNAPSTADGIVTKLYSNKSGSWKSVQVFPDPTTMNPKPDPTPEKGNATGNLYSEVKKLDETSYTWNMSGKGFFATCDNTGKTPTGEMTFLGWSNKKFKLGEYDPHNPPKDSQGNIDKSIIFYPVAAPSDPANPGAAGVFDGDAKITIDVDKQNPKPSGACTDEKGKVHKETLYGVWAGEPIHQYSVIFAANSSKSSEDDVEVVYGKKADWDNYSSTGTSTGLTRVKATIDKTYKKDNQTIPVKYYDGTTEVALTKDLKNTYRVFSEALPLPETPNETDSYKFEPKFWKDNTNPEDVRDLIVKAERKATADTRYVFKGWNTKADGTGTTIGVDGDGYITDTLEVKDTDYGNCDAYTHNIILYAQWEEVKIHNFQLIFYGYNANSLGYYDGTTWKSDSNVKNYVYYIDKNGITDITLPAEVPRWMYYVSQNVSSKYDTEGADKKMSYSWGETADSAEKLRVMAAKNKDDNYEYEFVGWSEEIKEPSETFTASDAEYHADASGYIQEKITIKDLDTDCSKPTHTLVLYPVFKKIPIHNFSVTMDLNGGTGLRKYNEGNSTWSNYSTYTFYKPEGTNASTKKRTSETESSYTWSVDDFWSKNGFGAYMNYDKLYTYELMGWSTVKKDVSENPDTSTNMVSWAKDSTEYASGDKAQMTPYVNGFINQDIVVNCDKNPCEGGSHNVTLYAVWKRTPRVKTYTLKFDANGGVDAPEAITQTKEYDAADASGWNSDNFTLTNQQIIKSGMKNGKKVFVGWHENANADNGRYGERNTANEELEQLTQGLTNPYTITNTELSTILAKYTAEKTLYAIWWYEYQLDYNANGGSGAPEHDHAYTSDSYYSFKIADDQHVPSHVSGYKFLGWSKTRTTPGQGTEADVDFKPSVGNDEVRYRVDAEADSSGEMGYTGKTLYAVWGPAN